MSGLSEVEQWVQDNWTFECGEDVNDVFEEIDEQWNPDLRFDLAHVLRDDLPDFMIWLQEQIDDECEDTTDQITFPPERDEEPEISEEEIDAVKDELSQARQDLLRIETIEREEREGGIVNGIKRFIRNIFRG